MKLFTEIKLYSGAVHYFRIFFFLRQVVSLFGNGSTQFLNLCKQKSINKTHRVARARSFAGLTVFRHCSVKGVYTHIYLIFLVF